MLQQTTAPQTDAPQPHSTGLGDIIAGKVEGLSPQKAEAYVDARIAYRVERLCKKFRRPEMEPEDFEQDFRLRLLAGIEEYDPAKTSWRTFVCMVLDRHYRHLVRKFITAQRHAAMSPLALDDANEDFAESIPDPRYDNGGPFAAIDLRLDIDSALSGMPERLRGIAALLMTHRPIEVAEILGVSPASVTRAIKRIRPYLEEAGLGDLD
jgi:RNA polymerase sigma factor (sigma-70 family)